MLSGMKASDLFVRCLEEEGVDFIFGVPGEENADFMMSLENSDKIRFILCRHEQAAAFMADVYGRLTGRAAVCLGTLGPGATNLVTGVADANMDRAPLICLTGQADSRRQHKESHQAMDVVAMFEPITKWATPIIHPDNIPEVVRKAFKLATIEKPGAVHIELAEDIAKLDTDAKPIPPKRLRRPVTGDKIVDQAMAVLRDAKNPIILAGNGAIRKRASKQLRIFAEQTGIGVVNTFMGKGALPYTAPLCLFTVGLQAKDHAVLAMDKADVVITVGYDLVEYHPRLWNTPEHCKEQDQDHKKIIHLDFLPAEVDDNYRVEVEMVGDMAHTLWMLNERLRKEPLKFDLGHQHQVRETMLADFAAHKDDETQRSIRPQKVLWDVREVMGPRDILLSDVGAHKMWIARYFQADEPNTVLISNGFCSMGFAMPGAMAASLIYPERKILAICGDAGFLMNVQDLETAKRLGMNIVVMVWEDKEYGLIAWKQETEFGHHTDLSFENPDFLKLADAFGIKGLRVDNAKDLKPALEEAFAAKGPALLSLPIDYRENALLTKRLGNISVSI